MPRGVEYRIPLRDLLDAAEDHANGMSLRAIARMGWESWGYASEKSALEGLRHALRSIDAPIRGRIEQTVLSSTKHGNGRRAFRDPNHPEHERHLAQRRKTRAARRKKEQS